LCKKGLTQASHRIGSLSVQSPGANRAEITEEFFLRKDLGKKTVWQCLSFLGSATYEKCAANAHNVSLQNYCPPNPTCQFLSQKDSEPCEGSTSYQAYVCTHVGLRHSSRLQCLLYFQNASLPLSNAFRPWLAKDARQFHHLTSQKAAQIHG